MSESRFYVVWCPLKGLPKVRHSSKELAEKEALRLAINNPGFSFFVLESLGVAESKVATYSRLDETSPAECKIDPASRRGESWDKKERSQLVEEFKAFIKDIADTHGRTAYSIECALKKEGVLL